MLLVVGPSSLVPDHLVQLRIDRFFYFLHFLQTKRLVKVDDLLVVILTGRLRNPKVLPFFIKWPADFPGS